MNPFTKLKWQIRLFNLRIRLINFKIKFIIPIKRALIPYIAFIETISQISKFIFISITKGPETAAEFANNYEAKQLKELFEIRKKGIELDHKIKKQSEKNKALNEKIKAFNNRKMPS